AAHGVGRRVGRPARASVRARDRRGDARHRALPLLGAPGLPRPDRVRADTRAGRRPGAPEPATMRRFAELAQSTPVDEIQLHRSYAAEFGNGLRDLESEPMAPTTRTHADFLVRIAAQGDRAGPTRTSAAASRT